MEIKRKLQNSCIVSFHFLGPGKVIFHGAQKPRNVQHSYFMKPLCMLIFPRNFFVRNVYLYQYFLFGILHETPLHVDISKEFLCQECLSFGIFNTTSTFLEYPNMKHALLIHETFIISHFLSVISP